MQQIHNIKQLDVLFVKSTDLPVLLFKHSTECHTSAKAKGELERFAETAEGKGLAIAIVNVIEDRPVSNAVTARTGVTHQSPQAMLIDKGDVVWHASHGLITKESLKRAVS